MNLKARQTVESHHMLMQGDRVVAAVSGGADSVALLHFLCFSGITGLQVEACHLDHGLRGEESDRDRRLVESMCREYGVRLFVERVDVAKQAKEAGVSVEVAGRELRYAFFERLSAVQNAKIATAHTLSDTAETVLLNMSRGTGLDGFCGIPYVRGRMIRPLLDCSRGEIEDYCRQHGLSYHQDSTNDEDVYTRNYIRHHVLPPLTDMGESVLRNVGAMTRRLRQDRDFLWLTAQQAWVDCQKDGGLDVERLLMLHPAVRSRLLLQFLEEAGAGVSANRVAKLEEMLQDPLFHTMSLSDTLQAKVKNGVLFTASITPKPRRRGLSPKNSRKSGENR